MLKEAQIEKLLADLIGLKDELKDLKLITKEYKIESDKLTELKKMRRDISDEMKGEKARIEEDLLSNDDYKDAKEREVKTKEEVREKSAQLKLLMSKMNPELELASYKYTVAGELINMEVERAVKIYINGHEEK